MKNLRLPDGVGLSILVGALPIAYPFKTDYTHIDDPIIVTITRHEKAISQLTVRRADIVNLADDIQTFLDEMFPPDEDTEPRAGPQLVK